MQRFIAALHYVAMMSKARVASLFAGIGGICLGFKQAGSEIIYANEIDHNACETYRHNFEGAPYLVEGDIYREHLSEDMNIDIVVAGFPCQAFSIAGYRKGFQDERGVLFTQVHRIVKECNPKAVFLENVKNLMSHDNGNTYRTIKESFEALDYEIVETVMNTMNYGNIPQNRERIYVVAFKKQPDGSCQELDKFSFPNPVNLTTTIHDIIDYHDRKPSCFYYADSHKYYEKLNDAIKNPNTIYQWRRTYVRENKSNVCPTLTANMGTGGHNVPLIRDDFGIRKLTPEECLAFQGFPSDFSFPDIAKSQMYKQAGNSVSVPVIRRIAKNILKATGFEYTEFDE